MGGVGSLALRGVTIKVKRATPIFAERVCLRTNRLLCRSECSHCRAGLNIFEILGPAASSFKYVQTRFLIILHINKPQDFADFVIC